MLLSIIFFFYRKAQNGESELFQKGKHQNQRRKDARKRGK